MTTDTCITVTTVKATKHTNWNTKDYNKVKWRGCKFISCKTEIEHNFQRSGINLRNPGSCDTQGTFSFWLKSALCLNEKLFYRSTSLQVSKSRVFRFPTCSQLGALPTRMGLNDF